MEREDDDFDDDVADVEVDVDADNDKDDGDGDKVAGLIVSGSLSVSGKATLMSTSGSMMSLPIL